MAIRLRGVSEFTITLATGRPELITELPITVKWFKPQIDEVKLVIYESDPQRQRQWIYQPVGT